MASTSKGRAEPNRWAVLCLLGIAQLMVVLDATIINIALPSAQKDRWGSPPTAASGW